MRTMGPEMINFEEKPLRNFTFADLFAGMGGFHLALESLGAQCVYASEWDKAAQDVYAVNFGVRPDGDITKVDEASIPDHDILCGGFPCQPYSISGKQLGFEDARGTLFFDVCRIVKAKRPKIVFLENVKNLANHDEGRTMGVIREAFDGLGYDLHAAVLNPVNYGMPTKRERIYLVAVSRYLHADPKGFSFPQAFPLTRFVEDFLLPPEDVRDQIVNRPDTFITRRDVGENSDQVIRVGHVAEGKQGYRIYSPKGVAITFAAQCGGAFGPTGGYLVDGVARKLHPREAARIMGYPDTYTLHPRPTQAYKQIGNSVVVDVIQLIGKQIAATLRHDAETNDWLFADYYARHGKDQE